MPSCPRCRQPLSAWEAGACLTCFQRTPAGRVTTADAAVRVLEREERPIRIYDIARAMERDLDVSVALASVQVALSRDPRVCWGGKGIYGLFRHGLIPGPRNLAGVALFLLLASEASVPVERLAFVMKWRGYRFQDNSLQIALSYEDQVMWPGSYTAQLRDPEKTQRRLMRQGFAPSRRDFEQLLKHGQEIMNEGLAEYCRRIQA
jgi:hypothetical protein